MGQNSVKEVVSMLIISLYIVSSYNKLHHAHILIGCC